MTVETLDEHTSDLYARWETEARYTGPLGALYRSIDLLHRAVSWGGVGTPEGRALLRESEAWAERWAAEKPAWAQEEASERV